jgi:hypothetical protein
MDQKAEPLPSKTRAGCGGEQARAADPLSLNLIAGRPFALFIMTVYYQLTISNTGAGCQRAAARGRAWPPDRSLIDRSLL